MKDRFALVLNNDGSKGDYEIGVFQALNDSGSLPYCIIGGSIGGVIAAVMVGNDKEEMLDFLSTDCLDALLKLNAYMVNYHSNLNIDNKPYHFEKAFFNALFYGDIQLNELRSMLLPFINEIKIRTSPVKLGLITADPESFQPTALMINDIPKGELINYLLIGAAIPVRIDESIDGSYSYSNSFFENSAIHLVKKFNCSKMLLLDPPTLTFRRQIRTNYIKSMTIPCSEFMEISLDPENKRKHFSLGYLDGLRFVGSLAGKSYYIHLKGKSEFYKKLHYHMGCPADDPVIRRHQAALLKLPEYFSQSDAQKAITKQLNLIGYTPGNPVLDMLEAAAQILNVDRINAYDPDDFIEVIVDHIKTYIRESINEIQDVEITSLLQRFSPQNECRPIELIDFLSVYSGILMRNDNFDPMITALFKDKISPNNLLAMIVLIDLYLLLMQK